MTGFHFCHNEAELCSVSVHINRYAACGFGFGFMLIISHYSRINSPVEAQANKALTGAVIEYARGLAVVKSFGKDGAAMATVTKAIDDSRKIHQKIEWAMFPATLCICWLVFMTRSKAIFPSADIICGNLPATACLSIFRWYFKTYICSTIRFESIYASASLTPPKKK